MYFIIEDLKKKKKSKNLVSSRSREPSLVSRLVSWDKCLVTPLILSHWKAISSDRELISLYNAREDEFLKCIC